MFKRILKHIFLILIMLSSSSAFAFTGYVSGILRSYNNLGQYCPDDLSRSCVGSNYNESDANSFQPLRHMKVRLYNGNHLIGVGTTNIAGAYLIQYSSPTVPGSLKIRVRLEHRDGRFRVFLANGHSQNLDYTSSIVYWNTSASNPQYMGTIHWGSAGLPIKGANIYEGAWRTWHYAFRYSAPIGWHFNNVKILNGTSGNVSSSNEKKISILSGSQFQYHTIAHEMGHVGSSAATNGGTFDYPPNVYCYPNTSGTNCNHTLSSQEWGSAQFEEGLATFMGMAGAFDPSSHDPIYCIGQGEDICAPPSTSSLSVDLETSLGSNCTNADRRREINSAKYMRDLYDNTTGDGMQISFSNMMVSIHSFYNGIGSSTGNHGKNEPWSFWKTYVDDFDGRSTRDYRYHIENDHSLNTNFIYNLNCNPVGD